MDIEGLDQYSLAPDALDPPEWITLGVELWAPVDGTCQPVAVGDAGQLEVTTCVDDDLACGVAITASGDATLDRAWCRNDGDIVTGLVDDRLLRLVAASDDHAAYEQLVGLHVVTVAREPSGSNAPTTVSAS